MIYNNVSLFYHNIIVYFEFYLSNFENLTSSKPKIAGTKMEDRTKWNTFTGFRFCPM